MIDGVDVDYLVHDLEVYTVKADSRWADILEWGRYRPHLIRHALFNELEQFDKINNWRKDTMGRRVFTIELKCEMEDQDPRFDPMVKVMQRYARDLLATATLLVSDKKPPEVVTFTEDQFFSVQDIEALPVDDNGEEIVDPALVEAGPVTAEGNEDGDGTPA